MDNIRGPDYELAEVDYMQGMKYKDIAAKYNVSINTVKSWKTRYKWNRDSVHTDKKVCIQKKKVAPKKEKLIAEEVEEVLENTELTDKQRLFCIYHTKYFNATKAAIKAGYSKDTAGVIGYQLLQKTSIKNEIDRLKQNKLNRAMLSPDDVFQKYIDIGFADITDYVEFGQEEVPIMTMFGPAKDEEGNELTKMVNVVKFKQATEVDGTIISEVKQGKDGASIKLYDKMKALQWLSDRLDLLPTETKIKIESEKIKVQMAQEKLALEKSKVTGDDGNEEDDGFLEALKGTVTGVWSDE